MSQPTLPTYIAAAKIEGLPIRHSWESEDHFIHDSPAMENLLFPIAFRGVASIATGISEWIIWRFEGLTDSTDAKQFVEACWAGLIDWRYRTEWRKSRETNPVGPIDSPLASMYDLLNRVFQLAAIKSNGVGGNTIYLVYLARHVLPRKPPFENWLKGVLGRFAEAYPRKQPNPLGPPIPRQALQPNFESNAEESAELLRQFLSGLNPSANPYLRQPDEMIKLGFAGTPYSL
jgi:hypothetical protein